MDYSVYGLRVGSSDSVRNAICEHFGVDDVPQSVRVAAVIPLSNQGWPPEAIGALLRLDQRGILIGAENVMGVPGILMPWGNIAYIAEGLEPI